MFSWLRKRRRRRLASRPFPAEWDQWIEQNFAHVAELPAEDYGRLQSWVSIFIAEKYWEGCDGLRVTEEMQATIAAHAGYMVRGKEGYYYDHLRTILIYPQIVWRASSAPQGGVVSEGPSARLGEALQSGPVSLVWPHVLSGGRGEDPGRNVVFHEFAHVLDWEDQFLDGTPHLDSAELFQRWQQTINAEYQALVNADRRGQSTLIDPYGATNIAEFFAVSTECFFEEPELMSHRHPEWFGLLSAYYKVNPLDHAS
jgi:Mlc titration factor MtfA (ptsG expression regulator)